MGESIVDFSTLMNNRHGYILNKDDKDGMEIKIYSEWSWLSLLPTQSYLGSRVEHYHETHGICKWD